MSDIYHSAVGRNLLRAWCLTRLDAWSNPHERRVLKTSLGPTHLVVAGTGTPTVIYLPGATFNAATSLGLLSRLSTRCRVVAVDLPGQPGLSAPDRPDRNEATAYGRWAGEVIEAVVSADAPDPTHDPAADRIVLAGHSMGAAVALSAPPGAVDELVLIDPAGLCRARLTPGLLATFVPWRLRPTRARAAKLLGRMSGPAAVIDLDLAEWLRLVGRYSRTSGVPGPLAEAVTEAWRQVPRRVLSGEHDCFYPADRLGPHVRERLGVELDVLEGRGHLTTEEAPDAVASGIIGASR